jgi:hypothetical protein
MTARLYETICSEVEYSWYQVRQSLGRPPHSGPLWSRSHSVCDSCLYYGRACEVIQLAVGLGMRRDKKRLYRETLYDVLPPYSRNSTCLD